MGKFHFRDRNCPTFEFLRNFDESCQLGTGVPRILMGKKGTDNHDKEISKLWPILISATFDRFGDSFRDNNDNAGHCVDEALIHHHEPYDVTHMIVKLVQESHDGRLRLMPPPILQTSSGHKLPLPRTFKNWYTRYFGDPCRDTKKVLLLFVEDPVTHHPKVLAFRENQPIDLGLKVTMFTGR